MEVLEKMKKSGIVPVVVLNDASKAVDAAKALLKGGISVMEITFRTAAAADSIKAVAVNVPEMLVGAGTVVNVEQAKLAVKCGASFIVSPGYDEETVSWCCENNVTVCPGTVTPTEIMAALKHGLSVLKFFPANVYGGLSAIKSLAGPFGGVKFIPTGGINEGNVGEFARSPFIHAVGGSWICPQKHIDNGNFEEITRLTKNARNTLLGFELGHVGINAPDSETAMAISEKLSQAFGFAAKEGNSSVFSSDGIEIMKSMYLGKMGHIAIKTNSIAVAIDELERRGFKADMSTAKYKGERINALYLTDEIEGFAIHLLQK